MRCRLTNLAVLLLAIAALSLSVPVTRAASKRPHSAFLPSLPTFRSAAAARSWGEAQEHAGNLNLAAQAYLQEAALRTRMGDPQGAEVERRRALRIGTNIALAVPLTPLGPPAYKLVKWEPECGCYLGVLDTPGEAHSFPGESNAGDFSRRIGRPLALAYQYARYGQPFPSNWAERNAESGRAIQIAMEPNNIHAVRDDDYLENWARDAAQFGSPVFLRFGGEMNGAWTPWHSDPAAYRRAFRIVARVMQRLAPNVAMVWAPNDVPVDNLESYYPGDDVVDWVGISLYIVRYYDDRLNEPAWQDNPATFIEPFYAKYASRKPLCLVECGVTHRSRVENTDAGQFAAARIQDLLSAIKVRFPRLKMFCWFDRNNLSGAQPGRRLNDYSLPDNTVELDSFRRAAADPYFLAQVAIDARAPYSYQPVVTEFPAGYQGPVEVSIRTYTLTPNLEITRANHTQKQSWPYEFTMPPGPGPLLLTVRDPSGRAAAEQTYFAR